MSHEMLLVKAFESLSCATIEQNTVKGNLLTIDNLETMHPNAWHLTSVGDSCYVDLVVSHKFAREIAIIKTHNVCEADLCVRAACNTMNLCHSTASDEVDCYHILQVDH